MTTFGDAGEAFVSGLVAGICAGNSPDVWGEMRAELPSEPQKVHVVTAAAIEEALGRLFAMPCVVADACDLLAVTPNKSLDLDGFAEKTDGTLVVNNFAHAVRYLWGDLGVVYVVGKERAT